MNFNVGGFNESIKYSYQQFCKQDAEGRESNRQLLVKLKKFEAKSFDLVAQTQVAQQMRNQYERMLMQQNPVLWAKIQKSIIVDMANFEVEHPITTNYSGGRKHTREMAINTSHDSSTSEQHSLHEEGVWPHTPSPFPEIDIQQFVNDKNSKLKLFSSTLIVPHSRDPLNDGLNKNQDNEISNSQSVLQSDSKDPNLLEHSQTKQNSTLIPETHLAQNIAASLKEDDFLPASSSTLNVVDKQRKSYTKKSISTDIVSNFQLLNKESNREILNDNPEQEKDVFKLKNSIKLKTPPNSMGEILAANPITTYDKSPNGSNGEEDIRKKQTIETAIGDEVAARQTSPPQSSQIKPFCLDSESDGADDPISGPLSGKKVGDDDSDSFWN